MKNLIICQTPLQVLIAEKIIEHFDDEEFIGIYLSYSRNADNIKTSKYMQRLKNKCLKFHHFKISNPQYIGGFTAVVSIQIFFSKYIYKTQYNKIFLANINSELMHFILDKLEFNTLVTFDDGFANINLGGPFFLEDLSYKQKFIRKFFKIQHNLGSIHEKSKKHFTIYNGIKNVFPEPEYIQLFSTNYNLNESTQNIAILIGQPLYLHNKKVFGPEFINMVYKKINPDFYLAHPLEDLPKNINILETDLIAEDLICNLIMQGNNVTIYSFFSSVMFSFLNNPNVNIVSIHNDQLQRYFASAYKFIADLNIQVLELGSDD